MRLRGPWLLAAGALVVLVTACTTGAHGTASPSPASRPGPDAGYQSATYANEAHWLCRPDLSPAQNVCAGNLDVTSVAADGTLTVQHVTNVSRAPVDCFYVYPTVDPGAGSNEDIDAPHPDEITVTRTQAGPFGRVCNVYAPLYRQATRRAIASPGTVGPAFGMAYGDVQDAFRYYLGHFNQGRPFVLLGHSQGSLLLTRLMSEMIDPDPSLRRQMVSAVVPGWSIQVPVGRDVGGTFANIPACRAPSQVNCVIGYSSFRATSPPPGNSLFGRSTRPGLQDLCTNPSNLASGSGPLLPMFDIGPNEGLFAQRASMVWVPGTASPPIRTAYVALPQLVTSQCVNNGEFSYLSLTIEPTTGPRAHDIPGDLTPQWGMHLVDVNVAQGNLVATVQQQAAVLTHGR